MGFSDYTMRGVIYPILTCDTCGKPIKDARLATIGFPDIIGDPISHATSIYHNGKCDPGHEVCPGSYMLLTYLQHLVWNLPIGKKVVDGQKRQLIIELPEPNDMTDVPGKLPW